MNFGELKARVRDALQVRKEDLADDLRYPDSKLSTVLNEGHRDLVVRSGCYVKTTSLTTEAYSYQYTLPADCVNILRMQHATERTKVWPLDIRHVDSIRREWRDQTGIRLEWYHRFSLGLLFVGPRPAEAQTYTIWYTADPGLEWYDDDEDEDSPVASRFHPILVDYAVGRLLLEGARGEEMVQRVGERIEAYEAGVSRVRRSVFDSHDIHRRMDQGWADSANYGVPV